MDKGNVIKIQQGSNLTYPAGIGPGFGIYKCYCLNFIIFYLNMETICSVVRYTFVPLI